MFSKSVIDSDTFIDMPLSTQALYFHLCMRADDDGFINNPKVIKRIIGASDDDLRVLFAKNFLLDFDTGVIVVKHWRVHNTIQKDRYKQTSNIDEFKRISVLENKEYQQLSELDTKCLQNVSNLDTQIRLDKISVDKDREEESREDKQINFSSFEKFYNLYPSHRRHEQDLRSMNLFSDIIASQEFTLDSLIERLEQFKASDEWQEPQYVPKMYKWLNEGVYKREPINKASKASKKEKVEKKQIDYTKGVIW